MKGLILIVALVAMTGFKNSVQPLRKPFTQIRVDGKPTKSGDILTVKPGQKLLIEVKMEGGRRDYCKFPDIYADITGTAQILSRGENGITYQMNGEKAEWKLTGEATHFDADEFLQVKTLANPLQAELTVSNKKFTQSYLKITASTSWQFTKGEKTAREENLAEETLYFKVAGESDIWFSTRNVQARGIKNEQVQEKLQAIQAVNDSIEANFYKLNFGAVQQSIRNLQTAVNTLRSTIDEVTAANPAYKAKVTFVGLPSDNAFKDMGTFSAIKSSWVAHESLVKEQKQQMAGLPAEATPAGKKELIKIISVYGDWQNKLPESSFLLLARYIPGFREEAVRVPETVSAFANGKSSPAYTPAVTALNAFLDQRGLDAAEELQKIGSVHNRLQAVKLFDNMLRSYLSSIFWAEWKDTREQNNLHIQALN